MENTIIYSGIYKTLDRECAIEVVNDRGNFTFILDDLKFQSDDLENWTLIDSDSYTEEQLSKFTFSTAIIREGFTLATQYTLADYEVSFVITQRFFDSKQVLELDVDLEFSMGSEGASLKLKLPNDKVLVENNISDFEAGLNGIIKKLDRNSTLFNCYTCRYSSYSIYGSGFFASLLCYKHYKERFLKIENKADYSHLQAQGYESVQETSYCDEFQLPLKDQFLYK